jgi:hypothetical protein
VTMSFEVSVFSLIGKLQQLVISKNKNPKNE